MADILIVDDERDIRELISDILEDEGYTTRLAGTSDEAMAEVNKPRAAGADDPRHLAQGQQHGRDRHPQDGQARQPRGAGGHHLGPRQHRDRGRGDQAGRLRFHREALQHRPADGGDPPRDGNLAPAARERRAPRKEVGPGRDDRIVGGLQGAFEIQARKGHEVERPGDADRAPGRGQGGRRADRPRQLRPGYRALRGGQLPPPSSPTGWRRCCSAAKTPERGVEPGLLEEANGGILYFDEVADMPPGTQSKILRVLVDQPSPGWAAPTRSRSTCA
jgi:two-component system nitrogen regulation response regulator NtrX